MEGKRGSLEIEIALQYNDSYGENVFAFANTINTVDGGTHLSGFRSALTRTINNFASANGMLKEQKDEVSITGDDVREGLVAVVSVRLPQPQFEGQTKGKLNSDIKATSSRSSTSASANGSINIPPSRAASSASALTPPARAKPLAKRANSPAANLPWIPAACPENSPIARNAIPAAANSSSSRANPQAAPRKWAATANIRPSFPLKVKF